MIDTSDGTTYQEEVSEHQRKMRKCLRCQKPFESEWIGERICKRCKNSGVWRQGLATEIRNKRDLHRGTPTNSEH